MMLEVLKENITKAYNLRYPDECNDLKITEVVLDVFGGHLACVSLNGQTEICFVYPKGQVIIFYSTEELVRFLEDRAKQPLVQKLFSKDVMSGTILILLLSAVFVIGWIKDFNSQALTIIGSAVGLASGYFFGAKDS